MCMRCNLSELCLTLLIYAVLSLSVLICLDLRALPAHASNLGSISFTMYTFFQSSLKCIMCHCSYLRRVHYPSQKIKRRATLQICIVSFLTSYDAWNAFSQNLNAHTQRVTFIIDHVRTFFSSDSSTKVTNFWMCACSSFCEGVTVPNIFKLMGCVSYQQPHILWSFWCWILKVLNFENLLSAFAKNQFEKKETFALKYTFFCNFKSIAAHYLKFAVP